MKQHYLRHTFLLLFFISAISVSAQTSLSGHATITADMEIILDGSGGLYDTYVADISHLGFRSEEDLQDFIGYINENIVMYSGDYTNDQLVIYLNVDAVDVSGWTVTKWNDHFTGFKTAFLEFYNRCITTDR